MSEDGLISKVLIHIQYAMSSVLLIGRKVLLHENISDYRTPAGFVNENSFTLFDSSEECPSVGRFGWRITLPPHVCFPFIVHSKSNSLCRQTFLASAWKSRNVGFLIRKT